MTHSGANNGFDDGQMPSSKFIEFCPSPLAVFDGQMRCLAVSHSWCEVFGYERDSLIGRCHYDVNPNIPAHFRAQHAQCLGGETIFVERDRFESHAKGQMWIRRLLQPWRLPDGTVGGIVMSNEDITAQVVAEERLEAQRAFIDTAIENLMDGIVVIDVEGKVVLMNEEARSINGMSSSDADLDLEREWPHTHDIVSGRLIAHGERPLARAWRGEQVNSEQLRLVTRDGTTRFVDVNARPVVDSKGQFMGVVGSIHDISRIRAAEASAVESARRHKALYDHTPTMLHSTDPDGRLTQVSDFWLKKLGYHRDAVIGQRLGDYLVPSCRAEFERTMAAAVSVSGEFGETPAADMELQVATATGAVIDVIMSSIPHRNGEKTEMLSVMVDISQRKEVERRLVQAQKMEAVGQLTGGLAHDFNNLLGVIMGNLQLLERRIGAEDQRSARQLRSALTAVEKGADLTRRLLSFSRKQQLDVAAIDVNPLIGGMMDLLRRTLGETIVLSSALADPLPAAGTDPHQLESAILNLAINARDAMPSGGHLMIETESVVVDENYARLARDLEPGNYVVIAVTDTGSGIPQNMLDHVFEPFFTTKEVGKGSGLGLSMIYGFAKQCGGNVKIYSEVECGTTVRLYLPVAKRQAVPAETGVRAVVDAGAQGTEKILIVEDKESMREVATLLLEDLGYEVLSAGDGHEALALITSGVPFDLLFTDIMMPGGMDGVTLAAEARKSRPALPVLFTTGYAEAATLDRGRITSNGRNLLAKPYKKTDLATKIRAALDTAEPQAVA